MSNISTSQYLNKTVLENDPFKAIDEEDVTTSVDTTDYYKFLKIHEAVTRSIEIISCFIAMGVCIFLIVIIFRFKKIRSSRTNIYILNSCVLYVIHTPLALMTFYADFGSIVLGQIYISVLILYMVFGFLLGLDWIIIAKQPEWSQFFDKYQKILMGIIYVGTIIEFVTLYWYALVHHLIRMCILVLVYVTICTGSIILNFVKKCIPLDAVSSVTSYAFSCSNTIVFSLLPLLVHQMFYYATDYSHFAFLTSFITETIFILHPVIVIYILARKSKQFRIAFHRSVRFLRKGYEEEELEDSDSDEAKVNGAQVNFTTNGRLDPRESIEPIFEVNLR